MMVQGCCKVILGLLSVTLLMVVACGDDGSTGGTIGFESTDLGPLVDLGGGGLSDDGVFGADTGSKPGDDGETWVDGVLGDAADGSLDLESADSTSVSDGGEADGLGDIDNGGELDGVPLDSGADTAPGDMGLADVGVEDAGIDDGGAPDSADDTVTPQPGPVWDLAMISDPATANCSFTNHHTAFKAGVLLDVWDVTYTSWESIDGALSPITIKAFAARPVTLGGNAPGIVVAHGLGGSADEDNATSHAARLSLFTLAYTGPGGGTGPENTSEGLGAGANGGKRLFDTIPDPRGSWIWGHAVAAMRGVTCLEAHPDVDPNRLGITGFSAGGVISLITASVDPRLKVAVPLSGTGQWDVATLSPHAWQHALLTQAELDTTSAEWLVLTAEIEPGALVHKAMANVMMVNGSTDEFFPLTAHVATFDPIPAPVKRTSIAGNFDHGCYGLTGVEDKAAIEERAKIRAEGGQKLFFAHTFGTDADFAYIPQTPQVTVTPIGGAMAVLAVVDSGGSKLTVKEVKFWASNDDAFFWANVDLAPAGNGIYQAVVPVAMQANTTYYVDVEYQTKAVLFPERFSISSVPYIPPGFVPHIRDINSCL